MVFAMNPDGSGFTPLHNFKHGEGSSLYSTLLLAGNTFYGTTIGGGSNGTGTVFKLAMTPQVGIGYSGSNIVLTWPTNQAGFDYTGYSLQSATNFASSNWSPVSPAPVAVNGQNTVTNPISGTQMFYRLSQ